MPRNAGNAANTPSSNTGPSKSRALLRPPQVETLQTVEKNPIIIDHTAERVQPVGKARRTRETTTPRISVLGSGTRAMGPTIPLGASTPRGSSNLPVVPAVSRLSIPPKPNSPPSGSSKTPSPRQGQKSPRIPAPPINAATDKTQAVTLEEIGQRVSEMMLRLTHDPMAAATLWGMLTLGLAYTTSNPVVSLLRRVLLVVAGIAPPMIGIAYTFFGQIRATFWNSSPGQKWMKPAPIELLEHVLENADPNAQSICQEIDNFCWKLPILNLGDTKGPILDDIVRNTRGRKPEVVVECGAGFGYSSLRVAHALGDPSGCRILSVDPSTMSHAVQAKLISFAGLNNVITQVYGTSSEHLRKVAAEGLKIDILILNHRKDAYLSDLVLALGMGLFRRGSIVVANNVLSPGCELFKDFVLAHTQLFSTSVHETHVEYSTSVKNEVLVSEFVGV